MLFIFGALWLLFLLFFLLLLSSDKFKCSVEWEKPRGSSCQKYAKISSRATKLLESFKKDMLY